MSLPAAKSATSAPVAALARLADDLRTCQDSATLFQQLARCLHQTFDAAVALFRSSSDGALYAGRSLLPATDPHEEVVAGQDSLVAHAAAGDEPRRSNGRHTAHRPVAVGLPQNASGSALAVPLPVDQGPPLIIQLLRSDHTPFSDEETQWAVAAAALAGARLSLLHARDTLEEQVADRTAALEADNEALQTAGRQQDTFIADVTGDLRLPLAHLNRHLALLEKADESQRDDLAAALAQDAARLGRIVDRLLAHSRQALAAHRLTLHPLDLNEIVAEGVRQQRPRADRLGQQLLFLPALNLPPVTGDDNQLVAAISDVVAHAVDTTTGGRIEARTRRDDDGQVHVTVAFAAGHGGQQAPNRNGRVDRRRYSEASAVPNRSARLATVREIIRLHDGTITTIDLPDGERQYLITLPAAVQTHGVRRF